MPVIPEARSAFVSGSSAAMCRYVNSVRSSRSRDTPAIGSFTFSRSSADGPDLLDRATRAPTVAYRWPGGSSANPDRGRRPPRRRLVAATGIELKPPAGVARPVLCELDSLATPIRTAA
jgi:hypothetical protein